MATSTKQPRLHLLSIGVSHYCEKVMNIRVASVSSWVWRDVRFLRKNVCLQARWALERTGASFLETKHFPAFHRLFVKKLGGRTSVPRLVIYDGEEKSVLPDSSDILTFCDTLMHAQAELLCPPNLQEAVKLWEREFDKDLGPHIRRWAYCHLLYRKGMFGVLSQGAPILERVAGFLMFPLIQLAIYKGVGCDKANAKERSLGKITAIFDKVSGALEDGRAFICGDNFTAADLTFAALGAPAVFPDGCGSSLPELHRCPPEMLHTVQLLRGTAAGQHILRMYETQRHKTGSRSGGLSQQS